MALGTTNNDIVVFEGIPYAAPPIGALRWREPQPAAPWAGSPRCRRIRAGLHADGCLDAGRSAACGERRLPYLNIWAPVHSAGAHLPVMVWIYGGGFFNGSASMPLYWGDQLARKGIILVTFGLSRGSVRISGAP